MAQIGNHIKEHHKKVAAEKKEAARVVEATNKYNNYVSSNEYKAEQSKFKKAIISNKDEDIVKDIFTGNVDFKNKDKVDELSSEIGFSSNPILSHSSDFPDALNDFVVKAIGYNDAVKLATYNFMKNCTGTLSLSGDCSGTSYSDNLDFGLICCS